MIVTQIEEWTKTRSKVYIDQEFAFVLYKGELRLYQIEVGKELAQADYDTIRTEVIPKRARIRAMNLLKNREYTTSQLALKLRQGLYPEYAIENALDYVASFHYTDDLRYALNYIRCHQDSRGRRLIEQDLIRRGISGDILQQAWQEWEELDGEWDEEKAMRDLLKKRHFDPENADWKECQRQGAFLMRKGFSAENIRRVLQADREW